MAELQESLVTQVAQQKMETLRNTALTAFNDGQILHALEIYGQALELAEALDDSRYIVDLRMWLGVALSRMGKLRQALAVMAPALRDDIASAHAKDFCLTLLLYIDIATEIPVSIEAIEKAHSQVMNLLQSSGHLNWRHTLLHLRAELYYDRGKYSEALGTEQEGWALYRAEQPCRTHYTQHEQPHFTADTHLDSLVKMSITLRDRQQAKSYLAEWEANQNNVQPRTRERKFCCRQSALARLEGRAREAVDWARRAVLAAEQSESILSRYFAFSTIVRAFLCIGDCGRARGTLARLFHMRHSEYGRIRYGIRLLWGDYHLACARQAAGIPPADDEYGSEAPLPEHQITGAKVTAPREEFWTTIQARAKEIFKPEPKSSTPDPKAAHQALKRARRAYNAALKVGQWIDEQLECTLRQEEIAKRYERVESIEQQVQRIQGELKEHKLLAEKKEKPIAHLLKPLRKLRDQRLTDEPEENLVAQAAEQQMEYLHQAGHTAYVERQLLHSADIFSRALEIAQAIDNGWATVHFRFWHGVVLSEVGDLRQALATLSPTLSSSMASAYAEDFYQTLIWHIGIAQRIPNGLRYIERTYTQAENFLNESGHKDWRNMLLLQSAILYDYRGMYREALEASQESWALRQDGSVRFTADSYWYYLSHMSLKLRDAAQARKYLAEWKSQENEAPRTRDILFCSCQSSWARLEGQAHEAVDWARRAELIAQQVDNLFSRHVAGCALARAFLSVGDSERARGALSRLFGLRHSENGHIRYGVRLLWGDYHLACARQAAGMAPADDEFELEFPPPTSIADPQATRQALKRARRAYDAALKVGKWIDEQLECTVRQKEIAKRCKRVEKIEERLAIQTLEGALKEH